ncbi:MAG TPA: hypothetical protein VIK78_12990 [Ruminiclostridium sp.]
MVNSYKTDGDTKFGVILSKTVILILAVFSIYLLYLNFWCSVQYNALIYAIIVIPVFAVIFLIAYKMNISPLAFAITILVLAFLSKGIFAALVDTQPVSDFNTFYQCAIKLINGDKSFGHTFYFKSWAYQTGPIIYYSAIMKFFGTGLLPLKLVNCFFMAGTNAFIYLIARKVSNDYTARFVALLYLIYPAPYFLTSVLTNQHFAACMFLAAIYILFIEKLNFILKVLLAGVLLSVGNAVRPLGLVIIIALVMWGIVELIRHKKVAKIGMVVLLVGIYLLVNFGIATMVKRTDVNPEGLSNNYPLWKFVIGFNNDSKGQFSYEDQDKIFYIQDSTQRNNVSMQVIKERLSIGLPKLASLINIKQRIMWAELDTLRWEFYQKIDDKMILPQGFEKIEFGILRIEKVYYLLVFILMILGLCRVFLNKRVKPEVLLLSMLLLCYFGVHILIEVQTRYRYFAVILMFVLAAKGSELLFNNFKTYRENTVDNTNFSE